jgi:3-dehydroquinate dehydratase I
MTKPQADLKTPFGVLAIGHIPRVVGTLSTFLDGFPPTSDKVPSDIIEVRLDEMPEKSDWLNYCMSIEASELPVLLTIRLSSEGGNWKGTDESRLQMFRSALENLSSVDIELKSNIALQVSRIAKNLGKTCVVSFHDFKETPPLGDLETVVTLAQTMASVVKISTMVKTEKDIQTLQSLLGKTWKVPICVIGMGALGTRTRIVFPTMGSCMTYGYLDTPSAPGQLPSGSLVSQLRSLLPNYNQDYIIRKQVLEYA